MICDHFSLLLHFFFFIPSCTSTFIFHSLSARDIHFSCELSALALWSFFLLSSFCLLIFLYGRCLFVQDIFFFILFFFYFILFFYIINPSPKHQKFFSLTYIKSLWDFYFIFHIEIFTVFFVTNCKYSSLPLKAIKIDGRHKNRLINIDFLPSLFSIFYVYSCTTHMVYIWVRFSRICLSDWVIWKWRIFLKNCPQP